ncbi:MAG: RnfABCDGE type electron transport complex subunit C [Aristaeellaceae bacterium]
MGDNISMLNKLKRAALGAHTPHDKATAASKPVPMPLPAQVRILMSQHIGAPAKPLVKKGDEVFVGTRLGEAGGFVSANIHSSVSGTVAAVEPFRLSNGRMCDSVVIKTDGKQTVDPSIAPPVVTDKASFLAAVRACGLVGLGGAGFPTDVKLQPKNPVDTLLINASECEVWLTSDTQEMLNCSDDIVRGIQAVLQYTGIPKCVIGIEKNKPECIDLLCKKTQGISNIEVKPLPSVYGTGAELILIEKCLGREVPHGGLPADAGAVVMNVTSVSCLGKYLATGMPVVERTITVDGDACAKPQNLVVPVGTAYEDIVAAVGIKGGVTLGKVVAGGAMMGPAVENLSYPTTKTCSGLILLSDAAAQPDPVQPCIRCGRCIEYCPMGLEPVEVNQAYAARDVEELGKLHVDYCFNCGSCSFVCPAKRPCTQMMSLAKAFYLGEIKKGGKK